MYCSEPYELLEVCQFTKCRRLYRRQCTPGWCENFAFGSLQGGAVTGFAFLEGEGATGKNTKSDEMK